MPAFLSKIFDFSRSDGGQVTKMSTHFRHISAMGPNKEERLWLDGRGEVCVCVMKGEVRAGKME